MELLLDTADVDYIKQAIKFFPIDGITTNPSIIVKEKKPYLALLKELDIVLNGKQFHIQLTATTYEEMLAEAKAYKNIISSKLCIKIPVSKDGIRAIIQLKKEGFCITATAVTTLAQGLLAAKSGADYIAFYINRTSNSGINGNDIVKQLSYILERDKYHTMIIGASYKSVFQINESILKGCKSMTIPKELFDSFTYSSITNYSILKFDEDIKKAYQTTGVKLIGG
jgi:fructose-6-phosphate aldolase 2